MTTTTFDKVAYAVSILGIALLATPSYAETPSIADTHVLIFSQLSTSPRATSDAEAIRPFRINVPQAALDDLRRRIKATRWPDTETVADRSQGIQLANLQELVRYWGTGYDWRKVETKLNALPQFVTTIDGLDIHFIHVRSKHENALPLIVTHGWPGSVIERYSRGRAEDHRDLAAGGHHGISGRGLSSPGNMGAARLSQPDLLQGSRQGRPFRRVGAAWTLCERTTCRVQVTQADTLSTVLNFPKQNLRSPA